MPELELLTVGRISIDLYCGQLGVGWHEAQTFTKAGEVPDGVVADVPVLWISSGALSQEPSRSTVQGMLTARGRRRHTILDLDYRPSFWPSREEAGAIIGTAIDQTTVAVGNREECAVAVGSGDPDEAARRLLGRGVELAIVKLGGEGVLVADGQSKRLIAPPPIEVLCGLGAGDAFGGALCHGLLSGWSAERSVSFANAAGGIVASRLLCSQAMPYQQEVLELMEGSPA
jgi:5-dehydro-2-deoxygluconokinase